MTQAERYGSENFLGAEPVTNLGALVF